MYLAGWLLSIDPKLWYLAASGAVWLVTYLWRRFFPGVWAAATAKSPALAQLWLSVLGALLSAAPAVGKPLGAFVEELLVGAVLSAIGAQGLHAMFKALPSGIVPYTGAHQQVEAAFVRRNTPPGGTPKLDQPPTAPKG